MSMEQDVRGNQSAETRTAADEMSDIAMVDFESYVNVELDVEKNNEVSEAGHHVSSSTEGQC